MTTASDRETSDGNTDDKSTYDPWREVKAHPFFAKMLKQENARHAASLADIRLEWKKSQTPQAQEIRRQNGVRFFGDMYQRLLQSGHSHQDPMVKLSRELKEQYESAAPRPAAKGNEYDR